PKVGRDVPGPRAAPSKHGRPHAEVTTRHLTGCHRAEKWPQEVISTGDREGRYRRACCETVLKTPKCDFRSRAMLRSLVNLSHHGLGRIVLRQRAHRRPAPIPPARQRWSRALIIP